MKKARKVLIDKIFGEKAVKRALCTLSSATCFSLRNVQPILQFEELKMYCGAISVTCATYGCQKASDLCKLASEAETEKQYEEACALAFKTCKTSRKPRPMRMIS